MRYAVAKKVTEQGGSVENAELLLKEKVLQIGLNENEFTVLRGGSYVVLDFGKEVSGGARILAFVIRGAETCKARLRFGESLGEACAELGEKGACNDHSVRDFTVELQNYSDMQFG